MTILFVNNFDVLISGSIGVGATSINVETGGAANLPTLSGGDVLRATLYEKDNGDGSESRFEVIEISAKSGDNLTISRDIESITGNAGGYAYPSGAGQTPHLSVRWSAGSAGAMMQRASNLSDLVSVATARTNLGLGTAATKNTGTGGADVAVGNHTHAQADVTGLTTALSNKLDSSSYTAADILTKVKTVDGSGSGLDADLLDGQNSGAFAQASHTHSEADITNLVSDLAAKLASSSYTAADVLAKLLTVDGAGSGVDADLLDGQQAAAFAQVSHTHAQANITGLVSALSAKLDAATYTATDVLAKVESLTGPLSNRQRSFFYAGF